MDAATLEALAGGPAALAVATTLAKTSLASLTRDARGEVLEGRCLGTGARAYAIRADLRARPPRVRCSCPARRRPCKHGLALLSRWLSEPSAFELAGQLEVPLLALEPSPAPQPPDRVRRRPDPKRLELQRRGLSEAASLLEELVLTGVETLGAASLEALKARADALDGLQLNGVGAGLRRLLAQLEAPHRDPIRQRAGVTTTLARLSRLTGQGAAWVERQAMASQGTADAGERTREEGQREAQQEERDLWIETALGRVWTLAELRAMGRARRLSLVELAWWRQDDAGLAARVDTSALVDLDSGTWFLETAIVPHHLAGQVEPKASHDGVLELDEALVYPGPAPARVRWRPGEARVRTGQREDWTRLISHAIPLTQAQQAARAVAFRESPSFMLVAIERAESVDAEVVLVDAEGERLAIDARAAAVLTRLGVPQGRWVAAISLSAERPSPRATLHAILTAEGPVRVGG